MKSQLPEHSGFERVLIAIERRPFASLVVVLLVAFSTAAAIFGK